ncbi:hypothetical protein A4X17_11350 [Plantibacter sp. H53]|nr:hypothetical protein A4X17_11350 [Plantibacter sp. H53]
MLVMVCAHLVSSRILHSGSLSYRVNATYQAFRLVTGLCPGVTSAIRHQSRIAELIFARWNNAVPSMMFLVWANDDEPAVVFVDGFTASANCTNRDGLSTV